eukprot:SAG31_NODE_2105_length_6432_cov_22.218696_4_plen_568_part_00
MWNPAFTVETAARQQLYEATLVGLCIDEDDRRHVLQHLLGRHLTEGELSLSRVSGPGPSTDPNHPWLQMLDADGNWLFHNVVTGEKQRSTPPGWIADLNDPWVRQQDPDGSWSYCNRLTGERTTKPPEDWVETNPNHPWLRIQNNAGHWVYSNLGTGAESTDAPPGWVEMAPLTKQQQEKLQAQLVQFYREEEVKAQQRREQAEKALSCGATAESMDRYASMLHAGIRRQKSSSTTVRGSANDATMLDATTQTVPGERDLSMLLNQLDGVCATDPTNILHLVEHLLANKTMLQVLKQQLAMHHQKAVRYLNRGRSMMKLVSAFSCDDAEVQKAVEKNNDVFVSKAKEAGLAANINSAFHYAYERRKHKKKEALKTKTGAAISFGGMMLKSRDRFCTEEAAANEAELYALAHARDFTTKQWEKNTKHLSGLALFRELFPPVAEYPCAIAMPLANFNKLVPKIYQGVVCEFVVESNLRHTAKIRPRLFDFIEDSLIREYGLKSLSRKTCLQMIATVHKHHEDDKRVRLFGQLSSMIPAQYEVLQTAGDCAEDFFFWLLGKVCTMACLAF